MVSSIKLSHFSPAEDGESRATSLLNKSAPCSTWVHRWEIDFRRQKEFTA